tara:strand:+ start:84 stop:2117 length:2034 start_codon:yes stop_codon:yes gene_type:complete
MSKISISNQKIQYENYGNYYLKAYVVDTNNAKIIYSSAEDATGFDKVLLDVEGFTPFIPHISGRFDLWLFPSEDEADENITTNALKLASNVTAETLLENAQTADYSNVGTTQILTDSKINQTYDQIEAGGLVDLPEVYIVPNFETNRTQIQREIAGLGLGGDGLTLGDALITTRDLSISNDYVREGSYFDRLDYPDFDNLLGNYVPKNTDFSKAILTETEIDISNASISGAGYAKSTALRDFGELNDTLIYYVRFRRLFILNKIDNSVFADIPSPTNLAFARCVLNKSNELIIMCYNQTGVTNYELNIYKLNPDYLGITLMHTTNLTLNSNFSEAQNTGINIVQDETTNDYKIIFPSTDIGGITNFLMSLIWVKEDFSESAFTRVSSSQPSSEVTRTKGLSFWNNNLDCLIVVIPNSGGISNTGNLPYKCFKFYDNIFNKNNGTKVSIIVNDSDIRFDNIPLSDIDLDGIAYENSNNFTGIYNEKDNQLIFLNGFGQYSGTSLDFTAKTFPVIIYNLSDLSIVKYFTSTYFINQGCDATNQQINFNLNSSLYYNKVKEYKTYTFDNKEYMPIFTGSNPNSIITFLNIDDELPTFVKNNLNVPHSLTSVSTASASLLNRHFFFDSNNDLYFVSYNNSTGRGLYNIYKLIVDNGVITELKRPAPPIAALGASKGYWKAV